MTEPVLIIMAAGMASRYGGNKQTEPVGPSGEVILDYSVYDAIAAGFRDLVIVIKEEMRDVFEARIGSHWRPRVRLRYAYQKLSDVPEHVAIPVGRVKPWGTGHAVLAARDLVDGPMAVINADDYYGREAFEKMLHFLKHEATSERHGLCLWRLENTLSEFGTVSRGICELDDAGHLVDITERKKIAFRDGAIRYTEDDGANWHELNGALPVSMNFFGFGPGFMAELEAGFVTFLRTLHEKDPLKEEYLLPVILGHALREGRCEVTTMVTNDRWFGVTNREDRPHVVAQFADLVDKRIYPTPLWA